MKDSETIKAYRGIFMKYLQGKELTEEFIDYVINHPNKRLRNVFCNYIQYLYFRREISTLTLDRIMEVVASWTHKLGVTPYKIELEDVRRTLKYLR